MRCSKEKEISEIHTDMKWVKNSLTALNKSINGNGQPGLRQEVSENTAYRITTKSADLVKRRIYKVIMGGGGVAGFIALMITVISRFM